MPSSEMSRSDLVRAFVEVGDLLASTKPLEDRMTGLCQAGAGALNCDHLTILLVDGDIYRGGYEFGLPPAMAATFPEYVVPRDKAIVKEIEVCEDYLLFNSAKSDPTLSRIAKRTGVQSVIIVPFTHSDGSPLGYLTASYYENKPVVTSEEAELAMGIARLAQSTMLRFIETQRRQEISQAMLEVADSERRRLSRDIHDDPLQQILALRIGLEGFRSQLDDDAMQTSIDVFVEQCRSASASLREVMLRTHPNVSELADLEEVLRGLVERQEASNPVSLKFEDERSTLSPSYLVPVLNRVAEQAARNTIQHADASTLSVHLSDNDGSTLLIITDDGRGFDPHRVDGSRLGLVSMRERTELLGGTFTIDSTQGSGTTISALFPHARLKGTSDLDPIKGSDRYG